MAGTVGSISLDAALNDTEIIKLCDDNGGVLTPFLRRITYLDGAVVSTTDTELDGVTAYVVTGAVVECGGDAETPGPVQAHFTTITEGGDWDIDNHPGTQSVTLIVRSGSVLVNSFSVQAGTAITWSVDGDRDPELVGPLVIGAATTADFAYIAWTTQ